MFVYKGAMTCSTCHEEIVMFDGKPVHIGADGTMKYIQNHGPVVGGGR